VIFENLIIVKGGAYNELKKALKQWIDLYSKDLQIGLTFQLLKNGRGNHVIQVDKQLDNEKFFFLVNYLKYPEGIEYKIEVEGFTVGKDKNILKGKELLVYISPNDKNFDNVFVVTNDNINYKVDFGGKIVEINDIKQYKQPVVESFEGSEIVTVSKKKSNIEKEEISINKIDRRFRIISIITLIAFTINLIIPIFSNDIDLLDKTTWVIFIGVGIWFLCDYEMLRFDKYYIRSLLISIGVFIYGYVVREFLFSEVSKMIIPCSIYPIALLLVQWPTRRIYKVLLKKEPKVDKYGTFADLVYTLILFLGLVVLPFLINDWIK
jgi:hypothetical protein